MNVRSQIDTSFWFIAPDISQGLGDRPIYLYFNTYAQASTVKVRQPANGGFTPITLNIPANSIDSINLTPFITGIENSTANTTLNNGLYISATQKVSTLYSIRATTNKEFLSLKGPKALGVDFYIPMQEFWSQAPATSPKSFSSFDIVASQNNTTVLITPKTAIIGHAANATFTVLLQQGQSFSCQDTARSATTSLGGSIVSANKPIAVTIQSSGLNQSGCLSSVADQITNSTYIGTDYIVNKGTATTEKIFILATQNNTQITINDGSTTTYVANFGETYVYTATQPVTYVKTNKPAYALHVSGYGCRLSGAQLPPFFCAGTFTTSFTRASSDSLALNLFTRTGFEGNFALNGNASLIPASAFTVVPGSSGSIKSARIYYPVATIPVGSHNTVTNTGDVFGLGVLNGAFNKGSAYAYVSEFESYPSINAGSDFTICANGSLALNAQIGGGNISGIWSTNGYGTFNGGFSALSNTYTPSQLDTTVKPVKLFLTTNGQCPQQKDTLLLSVKPSPLVNASVDQIVCGNNSNVLLNGTVAGGSSTGIWTSTGSGTFTPNSTTLNSTYIPSAPEISAGTTTLTLTSTVNGICAAVNDIMTVSITPVPTSNIAATSLSVCANNPTLAVSGVIGGASTTGKWTTNGTGSFNPSNISLNTNYLPSAADVTAGQVKLYLSSTNNGNCNPAKDSVTVIFTSPPSVNAGTNIAICKNNPATVLAGVVSGPTTTGIWSGGTGTFTPNNTALTATYTPSASELSAGLVNLVLSSTANGSCNQVTDNVLISFTNPPSVNAGVDLSACKNNSSAVLSGIVSGTTTTGIWAGGTGTFSPSSAILNATYTPSASELTAGIVSLTLTSTNNGNCLQVTDVMQINYTIPPSVVTGPSISACKNNPAAVLSGTVSGATTTGVWTGGAGSFNPSNAVLNPTYTPGASELAAGFANLTLTSSNNGNCTAVTSTIQINYTTPPSANAGLNISSCKNNAASVLTGTISGPTTTGIWTGGAGVYTPTNTALTATYTPSAGELAAGFVNLTLTSTGNGNCNASSDVIAIVFTNAPSVYAGADLFSCKNNANASLSGIVSGPTTTGIWAGGTGTFTPNNLSLNPIYVPSAADLAAGVITLTLTSTANGNCLQVVDSVKINYTPSPVVNAGADITSCKNNAASALSGTVSGATSTGVWSGGTGNYNPSNSVLTATYSPSASELTAGFATLILTSSNNGTCLQVTDTVKIVYTNSPAVNAGTNITSCKNNAASILTGTVSGSTTTGIWSGGTGTYTPNNTALTATYTPSASEITAGFVNLILTSTNNGNCTVASDNILINFTTAPSTYAGIDLSACSNNAPSVLSGSVNGPTTTGIWAGGTGTFTPSNTSLNPTYIPTAAEIAAGSVNITLTSTNNGNCNQVKDSLVINFTISPFTNAGIDLSSCKNNPVTALSGTVTGATTTGIWTGGTGSFNPGNTSLTTTYTPSSAEIAAGSVSLTLNSTNNGNCNQVSDTIVINFTNSPVVNAGTDLFACKNNASSVLAGVISGPTTTGVWTGGAGNFNPSNTALTATYTPSAGEIAVGYVNLILTSTNNGGCNSVNDLIRLNFMAKPFANFNYNLVCLNNTTTFTDLSSAGSGTLTSWEWTYGDGSPNTTTQNTSHTYSNAATYTAQLVVSNSFGCYDTIRKNPLIYPLPNANFGINRVCNGNLLTLIFSDSSTVSSPEVVNQWFWDFGGPGQSNSQNPAQLFPGSGFYTIKLIATTNHGCKDTVSKQLNLTPRPSAGFAYSISSGVNVGTTVNFVDTSSYSNSWTWNFGDAQGNGSNLQNPSTIYYDNGTYIITQVVSDGYGCSDTARAVIKINNITNEISTLIPNAISPNGDGKNDVWKLDFLSLLYPDASIEIYNRWGENVYSSQGAYSSPWDGTYKGQALPVGTYYYVLTLNDANNTEPFKGGILLIR
ncbi:MAG: PKD domain-containing protein [Bacteroidota bacterium]